MHGKTILIDPGVLSPLKIEGLIKDSPISVNLITLPYSSKKYRSACAPQQLLTYPDLRQPPTTKYPKPYADALWKSIIDDHQTFLLYDRTNKRLLDSASIKLARISALINACQELILRVSPSAFILMATPHNIHHWTLGKVCEHYGVPVMYFQESALPWRFHLLQGLRRRPCVAKTDHAHLGVSTPDNELRILDDFIARKSSKSNILVPEYETENARRNRGKNYSLLTNIRSNYRSPANLLNTHLCYARYEKLALPSWPAKPYVIFFLHYQPERSTLPEGYGFAQQLLAVQALRTAMPASWELLVKEHPATFRATCSWRERSRFFYTQLTTEANASLISVKCDTYQLIDNARVVATVTGTVGFEAYIRGRKSVAFGSGAFHALSVPEVHCYEDVAQLRSFLTSPSPEAGVQHNSTIKKRLLRITHTTFSGLNACIDTATGFEQVRETVRHRAILRGINYLLRNWPEVRS